MSAPRLAILIAEFNPSLVDAMLRSALDEARKLGAEVSASARVPGSYETPIAAEKLLRRASVDALVVLGYIERGETLHGEVMGHVVHRALLEASLRYEKPVGFGFIGPGATLRDAKARKDEYARAAVRAAVRMVGVLAELGPRGAAQRARPAQTRRQRR
jgi:6,7-dimethyl-8-ribityllumazine synthase